MDPWNGDSGYAYGATYSGWYSSMGSFTGYYEVPYQGLTWQG